MAAFGIGLVLIVPLVLFNNEPTSADDDFGTTLRIDDSLAGYLPPLNRERWSTADADHGTPDPFEVSPPGSKQNGSRAAVQPAAALVAGHMKGSNTIVNACFARHCRS
ncbi:hypothetical protein MTO96_008506 [Rhipicephalus appendiculatus]